MIMNRMRSPRLFRKGEAGSATLWIASWGVALAVHATTPAVSAPNVTKRSGDWQELFHQGYALYTTVAPGRGARSLLEISCSAGAGTDRPPSIDVLIEDKEIPEHGRVEFTIDGRTALSSSGLRNMPSDDFARLWGMLRSGRRLDVATEDGRRASFSLKGAAGVMPVTVCSGSQDSAPPPLGKAANGRLVGVWLALQKGVRFPSGCDSGEPVRYSSDGIYTGPGASGTWRLQSDRLTEIAQKVDVGIGDPAAIGRPFVTRILWEGPDRFVKTFSDGARMTFRRCPAVG